MDNPEAFQARRLVSCIAAVALVSGCVGVPQPWEKGHLARPEMGFDDDALGARSGDPVYASKEAATGGATAGGAGCGCN